MTEVAITEHRPTVPTTLGAPEPAIVAEVRGAVGPARLDGLAETLTPETLALVVLWLSSARRASARTRAGYARDIAAWSTWHQRTRGSRLDLAALSRADVSLWVAEQRAAGAADTSVARRLSALSSLYRYAGSHGIAVSSPITEDHRPRVTRGRTDRSAPVLSDDQMRALYAHTGDARDAVVLALLHTTALRVSELTAADDADLVSEGRRCWLWVTRKGGRRERVAIDPAVADLIDAYRADRPDSDGESPLIRDQHGARIDRHDITRMLRRIARAAGIRDHRRIGPHSLRATAVTQLADAGVSPTEIQQLTGHAQVSTVMIYVESRRRDDRVAAMTAQLAAAVTVPGWVR